MAKNFDLKDIKSLKQLREELRLQAHLFKADAKVEWKKLEADWKRLEGQRDAIKSAAERSATDVNAARGLLVQSVKEGYERIKRSLPS